VRGGWVVAVTCYFALRPQFVVIENDGSRVCGTSWDNGARRCMYEPAQLRAVPSCPEAVNSHFSLLCKPFEHVLSRPHISLSFLEAAGCHIIANI